MARKRSTTRSAPQARPSGRPWVDVPLIETPAEALVAVREGLVVLEVQRLALLARREELVVALRAQGMTWREIEGLAGCSRPALVQRVDPAKQRR